jgi:hypothetical protein
MTHFRRSKGFAFISPFAWLSPTNVVVVDFIKSSLDAEDVITLDGKQKWQLAFRSASSLCSLRFESESASRPGSLLLHFDL